MTTQNQRPSLHAVKLVSAFAALTVSSSVFAADAYFDINGVTAGSGATATGTTAWDTSSSAVWSTDSTGASSTAAWINGNSAIFSAGSDAANVRTLTNAGVTVDNITQQEGRVLISGSTLTLADTSAIYDIQTRVSGDYDLRIHSIIADSSGGASSITKTGAGILHLGVQANTFSGGVILNQGTLSVEHAGSLGTGTVTLNSGSFVKNWSTITTANAINVTGAVKVGAIQNGSNWTLSGTWQAGSTSGNFNVSNTASDLNGFNPVGMTIFVTGDVSAYTGTISHNTLSSGGNRLRFGTNLNATSPTQGTIDASSAKFVFSGATTGTGNAFDLGDGRYGTFKMGELSGTGGRVRAGWVNIAGSFATTFEVGSLNTSSTFAGVLENNGLAVAALNKVGTGTLTFTGANAYTGGSTVTAGTFAIGASNVLADTGAITLNGGTLAIGDGFSDTLGTLDLNASSGLSIGAGASLLFADSSALDWGSFTLSIGGSFISGSSIKFGSSSSALTAGQLAQISSSGFTNFGLDAGGFLTASAVPEPSSFAILAGFGALGVAALRRRRR